MVGKAQAQVVYTVVKLCLVFSIEFIWKQDDLSRAKIRFQNKKYKRISTIFQPYISNLTLALQLKIY